MPPTVLDRQALFAALRAVPGVRDAYLDSDTGADFATEAEALAALGVLRLDLEPGVQGPDIAHLVDEVLRTQFGVGVDPAHVAAPTTSVSDVAVLAPRPEVSAPAQLAPPPQLAPPTHFAAAGQFPAAPTALPNKRSGVRPSIARVHVASASLQTTASVTLALGGREVTGLAVGPAAPSAVLRTVSCATLRAVEQLVGNSFRVELDYLDVTPAGPGCTVVVVITARAPYGSEVLTGACLVGLEIHQAVVRASLKALNRRLELLLAGG